MSRFKNWTCEDHVSLVRSRGKGLTVKFVGCRRREVSERQLREDVFMTQLVARTPCVRACVIPRTLYCLNFAPEADDDHRILEILVRSQAAIQNPFSMLR